MQASFVQNGTFDEAIYQVVPHRCFFPIHQYLGPGERHPNRGAVRWLLMFQFIIYYLVGMLNRSFILLSQNLIKLSFVNRH